MKTFEIPAYYKSPIIAQVKAHRKLNDPRKKDFTPTVLDFGHLKIVIARHFGFCYGVENAIEIAYKAINENPGKRIFLLSEMIHNPGVNEDLVAHGIQFLQTTSGESLFPLDQLTSEDVVLIPAFGTTVEMESKLTAIGVDIQSYNTTCPFVEKVWNRSQKLGEDSHSIIVHGKHKHEETRATFSHAQLTAPTLVIKDMEEAKVLADVIGGKRSKDEFYQYFAGKYSSNFDPDKDLNRIGVVNQTTMLASETQEITDFLRMAMMDKYGAENIREHMADTRDTLCYATNDNQSATMGLLEVEANFAIVIGGHNSSNTTHLVELLEQKFPSYFIENESSIVGNGIDNHFDIHTKTLSVVEDLFDGQPKTIILTSGASCPDAVMDRVIERIVHLENPMKSVAEAIEELK